MTISMNKSEARIFPELNMEALMTAAMKLPMIRVERDEFLRRELRSGYDERIVELAVRTTPTYAGISQAELDEIAGNVIRYEATMLGIASAAASIPGGVAAFGAATIDSINYCAFSTRVIQELAYLYGFQDLYIGDGDCDSEMMYTILVFLGTMLGVQEASKLLVQGMQQYAGHLAEGLARKPLTQGLVYPVVKKISYEIGIRMTKQIYADSIASFVPIAGGLVSGGMSYGMFTLSCHRLQVTLKK